LQEIFGKVAGIFSLLGYGFYILSIFRGETKPSRTTWWIWSPLAVTLYFSAEAAGAKETLWVARSEVIGIITIALLSIRYGKKQKEVGENFCILGSVVSLIVLWVFKRPDVALIAALTTDTFALWPTIQKTRKHPKEEDKFAWTLTQTGNFINLFAIRQMTFGEIVYPVWLFVLDGVLLWFLFFPKRKERKI